MLFMIRPRKFVSQTRFIRFGNELSKWSIPDVRAVRRTGSCVCRTDLRCKEMLPS